MKKGASGGGGRGENTLTDVRANRSGRGVLGEGGFRE